MQVDDYSVIKDFKGTLEEVLTHSNKWTKDNNIIVTSTSITKMEKLVKEAPDFYILLITYNIKKSI